MKHFIKLFLIFIFCSIVLSACVWDRGVILFNSEPITKENALTGVQNFSENQKIYYLFIAPNRMTNKYIRVQISKMSDVNSWGGVDIIRTMDYRLMKDERYYHADSFILYSKGKYLMQVFSTDDFQHPLAVGQFFVH